MNNAKKNSINISKIHCLTFSNWNPMGLIYFSVHFIPSCPNFFLAVICLSTSSCTPFPHSPVVYFTWPRLFVPVSQLSCCQQGGITRLSQAIQIMSFLAGREICNRNTHCAFLTFRTLPGIMGPTHTKLALHFIHLAAKKLNLVSSNSSGNNNIKTGLVHSTDVKICVLLALTNTPASSVSGDHV